LGPLIILLYWANKKAHLPFPLKNPLSFHWSSRISPIDAAMAAAAARSRAAAAWAWARLISLRPPPLPHHHHLASRIMPPRRYLAFSAGAPDRDKYQKIQSERAVHELLAELQRERHRDREDRRKQGKEVDDDEEEQDYMGVKPLIEKLERRKAKEAAAADEGFWEPTDSDSDEDDERYTPDAIKRRIDEFDRKCKRHGELLDSFADAGKPFLTHSTPF
jgi:small subunit ribosomal protein S5